MLMTAMNVLSMISVEDQYLPMKYIIESEDIEGDH